MNKNFKVYLEEGQKEYHFRLKTVVELADEQIDNLERVLAKYDLRDMSKPTKTIIQEHPLDFQDIMNKEVFIVDFVTGLPASAYILLQEIRRNLNIPEKYIVVRTDNDPLEIETQRLKFSQEMGDEANDKGLTRESLLGTDSVYPDNEHLEDGGTLYGDEYNTKFKEYLAQVSSSRQAEDVDPPNPLFSWLDMAEESPFTGNVGDFNEMIKDAPKPVAKWDVDPKADTTENQEFRSDQWNYDDDAKEHKRAYRDSKTGKRTVLSRKNNRVRNTKD